MWALAQASEWILGGECELIDYRAPFKGPDLARTVKAITQPYIGELIKITHILDAEMVEEPSKEEKARVAELMADFAETLKSEAKSVKRRNEVLLAESLRAKGEAAVKQYQRDLAMLSDLEERAKKRTEFEEKHGKLNLAGTFELLQRLPVIDQNWKPPAR